MDVVIRHRKLDRALDRLDGIKADVAQVAEAVADRRHHDEILAANVARVDERVVAATEQAAEDVRFADRRAADAVAAVRAELREAKEQSIGDAIAMLRTDLDNAQRARDNWSRKVDELVGVNAELRAEVARLLIERDAARSAHDEARADAHEATDSCNANLVHAWRLTEAARAVLDDARLGAEARPKGGSRTRARRRVEALAALVEPTSP